MTPTPAASISRIRLVVLLTLLSVPLAARADCPPCGPDFCLNDPRYAPKLAAKKARLAREFPPELVALLDRDGACVARVDRAPDSFSIRVVSNDGSMLTKEWTPRDDEIARQNLLEGRSRAFYKFNVNRAFACCNEPKHDQRSDWVPALDLNRSLAIECKKVGQAVQCR